MAAMQSAGSLHGGLTGDRMGSFPDGGLYEAFGRAAGSRGIGPGTDMVDVEIDTEIAEDLGGVAGSVVGHDAFKGDPEVLIAVGSGQGDWSCRPAIPSVRKRTSHFCGGLRADAKGCRGLLVLPHPAYPQGSTMRRRSCILVNAHSALFLDAGRLGNTRVSNQGRMNNLQTDYSQGVWAGIRMGQCAGSAGGTAVWVRTRCESAILWGAPRI